MREKPSLIDADKKKKQEGGPSLGAPLVSRRRDNPGRAHQAAMRDSGGSAALRKITAERPEAGRKEAAESDPAPKSEELLKIEREARKTLLAYLRGYIEDEDIRRIMPPDSNIQTLHDYVEWCAETFFVNNPRYDYAGWFEPWMLTGAVVSEKKFNSVLKEVGDFYRPTATHHEQLHTTAVVLLAAKAFWEFARRQQSPGAKKRGITEEEMGDMVMRNIIGSILEEGGASASEELHRRYLLSTGQLDSEMARKHVAAQSIAEERYREGKVNPGEFERDQEFPPRHVWFNMNGQEGEEVEIAKGYDYVLRVRIRLEHAMRVKGYYPEMLINRARFGEIEALRKALIDVVGDHKLVRKIMNDRAEPGAFKLYPALREALRGKGLWIEGENPWAECKYRFATTADS